MGELLCRGVRARAGESRAGPASPRLGIRSEGRQGLAPSLPPGSGTPPALFPPSPAPAFDPLGSLRALMLAGHTHVTGAVLPALCSGFGPPWGLGKSCLFTFPNWKSLVQAKNLATFQDCYFCSFYFEQGIGLRKML